MKKSLLILLVFQFSMLCVLQAQDDDPWWKKLFKSGDTEKSEDADEDKTEKEDTKVLDNYKMGEEEDAFADVLPRKPERKPGNIDYKVDPRIDSLNKRMIDEPRELRGFRIQIYFGSLTNARDARADYIKLDFEESCYLEQSPPNFGVRVGDFRTREAAYEVLVKLKEKYPAAYIVPDQIELPELPE